jgi:hypothetical protein
LTPGKQDRLLEQIKVRREDGIQTIQWTKDKRVESIGTEDGQTLSPTPLPSRWPYLMIAVFPILGFLIAWGIVRCIGWVGVGFETSSM